MAARQACNETTTHLILKEGDRIAMGVVSVGGFLGIGNKLVAVPYEQLHLERDNDRTKITMPGRARMP